MSKWPILLPISVILQAQVPTPPPEILKAPGVTTEPSPQPVDPPRIQISPKGKISAGELGPREKKVLNYLFHNTSNSPITLRLMDLTLGTTVEGPALTAPIPSNGKAALTMHLDATNTVGYQRRNAKFVTDDPKQGHYMLPVEITVRPDLTVDAERKSFGEVVPHESPEMVFKFKRETGDPLSIKLVSTLPPYIESEIDAQKSSSELRLTLRPSLIAPGVRRGLETVKVESNAPYQPKFTLYFDWTLKPVIEAEPSRLVFLDPKANSKTLKLKDGKGKAFRILEANIKGDGFKVEGLSKTAAPELSLRILRTAEKECKALLEITFDGQESKLQVPLSYLPPIPPTPVKKKR